MRRFAGLARVASFAVATLAGLAASAQSLQISPVLLEMQPGRHGAVMEILNTAATAVDIQVRPYDWHQLDGHDELVDSMTLRVSPSIVTIPAGGSQTVRLLVPGDPRTAEGNWRILVDQLPQLAPGGGLQIRLRMSIPVFAYATKIAAADLRWRIVGKRLEVSNAGPRYARLAELSLHRPSDGDIPLPLGEMPYVLPSSSRHWDVTVASEPGLTVVGRNGTTAFSAPVALESVR